MGDRVHLFVTCLVDQFAPEAGEAACRVLEDSGCDVSFDPRQTCCGQPAMNLGHLDEARVVAGRTMDLYADTDGPIVVPSGSCAATMAKHYPDLFRGTDREAQARAFAERVQEWSHYLVHKRRHTPHATETRRTVTVHPACHGLRELGLTDEAETLLKAAGHHIVPLPRAENCCGFGGAFSVVMPEMSGAMLKDKLDCIDTTEADVVVTGDSGCLMHMRGGHQRRGTCPTYGHIAQLLVPEDDDASPA